MTLPFYLALRNLLRHPARNILYVTGISITAALLLDMILLSGGLNASLERILGEMGYEIRISPRGTLPFETDSQIVRYSRIRNQLLQMPSVSYVDALLGSSVGVEFEGTHFTSFALGLQQKKAVLYRILSGSEIQNPRNEILINHYLARDKGIRAGDSLKLRIASQLQTTGIAAETVPVKVAGIGQFYLDGEGQFTISCSLPLLQQLLGQTQQDPVSVILIKLEDPDLAQQTSDNINNRFPQLSAYTISTVIEAVDQQMSYFKQFSYILGGISLVVTFVLIFIITTISFHDRLGEIALLRAIGLSNRTLFSTILLEGILTSAASTVLGFLLGKGIALYLDAILTSAPGLPEDFSFFVSQPEAMAQGVLTLLITGFFAGLYPASAAISLPVADTLREEIL